MQGFQPTWVFHRRRRENGIVFNTSININCHGELWCPLVVRVPFILGTDLTESSTFTQLSTKYFSKPIMCQARPNQMSYPARTDHFLFHLCPHTLSTHPRIVSRVSKESLTRSTLCLTWPEREGDFPVFWFIPSLEQPFHLPVGHYLFRTRWSGALLATLLLMTGNSHNTVRAFLAMI